MRYVFLFLVAPCTLLAGGCGFLGQNGVLNYPQTVIAATKPKGTLDAIIVNGKKISVKDFHADVDGPRKNLAGILGVGIGGKFEDQATEGSFSFGIHIPITKGVNLNADGGITINGLNNKISSQAESYSTHFEIECPKGNGEEYRGPDKPLIILIIPRGDFILEQRTKHVTFKGIFDIPPTIITRDPYMICDSKIDEKGFVKPAGPLYRNPAPPVTIEVRGIHIDIDTDLIFQWCSKGATCYQK